jgi:hypothetical protein
MLKRRSRLVAFSGEVAGLLSSASEFNVLDKLWNARVTSHIAKDVVSRLSVERIYRALKLTDSCLRSAVSRSRASQWPGSTGVRCGANHVSRSGPVHDEADGL